MRKREIPRSYVCYLEIRVVNLEAMLVANNIAFPPPQVHFAMSENIKPGINVPFSVQDMGLDHDKTTIKLPMLTTHTLDPALESQYDDGNLGKVVDNLSTVSIHSSNDPRYNTSASAAGTSFHKVVYAAVRKTKDSTLTPPEKGCNETPRQLQYTPTQQLEGLTCETRSLVQDVDQPTVRPALIPDQAVGRSLVELYFGHGNPQIPISHRGEFIALFDEVYASDSKKRAAQEL